MTSTQQKSAHEGLEDISLVENVFQRLYSLLPIESNLPLLEVEEHQLFLSLRKTLLTICSSELLNSIINHFMLTLDKINKHDNYLVLKQRDSISLSSLLIVLRLLADLVKVNWDSKDITLRKDSVESAHSNQSGYGASGIGLGSAAIDYHTVPPDKLDSEIAIRAISLISRLKSTNSLAQELAIINGRPLPPVPLYEDIALRPLLEEIDLNCEAILRFLGASNTRQFFEFTASRLSTLKHNIGNDGDFAPYVELFSAVYLDEQWFYEYLRHIRVIMATFKKAAYRQLVLSYFIKALKIWIYARPQEFLNCCREDSKVSVEADALFDELMSLPDPSVSRMGSTPGSGRHFKTHYKLISTLIATNPKALSSFLTGSSASKHNALKKLTNFGSNKKQRFLSNLVKVLDQQISKDSSENASVLESLDFMVGITVIASCIYSYDPNHTIVKFALEHYELASKALVSINLSKPYPLLCNPTNLELNVINLMRQSYFTSVCVMNSNEFIPMLIEILNNPNSPLDTLNITCSILKHFSLTPSWLNAHQHQLSSMLPALRRIMMRMGNVVKSSSYTPSLNEEDDTVSLGKTSTTSSSDLLQYRSLVSEPKTSAVVDSLRTTSTPSSLASSTPISEKFKDTAKNLLKHHHSGNVVSTPTSVDDMRSLSDKDLKVSSLSRQVLMNAFEIFKKNPHAYFFASTEQASAEGFKYLLGNVQQILEPLVVALRDGNGKLATTAKQYIQSFINVNNIPDTAEAVVSAFTGSALIGNVLAKSILNYSSSENTRKDIMEYFVRILEYRTNLYSVLAQHAYFTDAKSFEQEYYTPIMSPIDQALMFMLCTPNVDTYNTTKRGFKALALELSTSLSPEVIRSNIDFYHVVADDSRFTTGNVALQKNVRKFFLKLQDPTPSVVDVWLRIYEKWYQFAKSDFTELTQTELVNFRNFAGFLGAIAGLFMDDDVPDKSWYTKDIRNDLMTKIEQFINQQFSMLGEDSLVTRENAKEILAFECHPRTYPMMIKILVPIVNSLVDSCEELHDRDLTIMEHVISLLKSVLNKGDSSTIFRCSLDILHCADQLASIVDSRETADTNVLKLRIRMSILFAEVERNRDQLVISSAYKLRNKFLRYVYNWFDHAVSTMGKQKPLTENSRQAVAKDSNYMYIDVAMESSKSLSLLLENLVLEAQQVLNVRELQYSKSSLFSIYFNTFLKALERYSAVDDFSVAMRHKINTISENIVVCLTNLLKSNVDVGLQYSLPIGYYTNLAIRVSFLKVFVSIVESYSKLDVANDPQLKKRMVSNIFRLIIEHPKFLSVLGNSSPSFEAPALASCTLSFASSLNQSSNLVSCLVIEEIMSATSYSDILRRNSFASRCLSAFGRTIGLPHLVKTLRPILTEIRDSEANFEVEKIALTDSDAEQNLNNFMHYLKKLVHVIISSIDDIPLEFKYVCKKISEAVDKKFTNSRLIAVGSFIFLRYFCPAIVSPETEKIVTVPDRQTQRKYLLLTKVVQNLANGTISTLKWPLLKTRESEITDLHDKVNDFLDRLTQIDDDVEFEIKMSDDIKETDYNFFHTYFYENWTSVREELINTVTCNSELMYFRSIAEQIDVFLKAAGQPTMLFGYELPPSITPESNPELYDFMSKYSTKDLGLLSDCSFVYQAFNQDGLHLLVFSYSEYKKIKDHDEELILYRIVQVASKIWDNKFMFVLDCTGNDGSILFPRRMMQIFGEFAPDLMRNNCVGIVYYNVSSGLYPKLMGTFKHNQGFQQVPSVKFSFVSGAADRKAIMNLGLSNQAIHAYSDVRVKFTEVSLFEPEQSRFIPVVLRIGNEFLQISQATPQRAMVRGELKEIFLNDVYHLEQIDNVAVSEVTSIPNEITVTFVDGKKLILASSKFLEIMRLLYFTKSRALSTTNQDSPQQDIQKTPEDMLGQMFNVIFLGLTSTSDEVRSISYNLLAVAQTHFKLDFGNKIVQFPEVYFPKDYNPFVIKLSEKLAVSSPHLTSEFITAFFDVYNDTITSRQRLSALLYVSPWVSNIYEHVYRNDGERGTEVVSKIISNFLNIATKDTIFLKEFNMSIFSNLCLEDNLSKILVDEVVLNAIDREASGEDWKACISLLTSFPTVTTCGHIIKKLREIGSIPFPNSKGKYSLEAQSNWTEITVLVHICVSLFFNSLTLTEMFLPDVFYIITILVDVGPLDLRIACHQFLLNVLQNFLSKKTISDDSRAIIQRNVEHFTSHRSRLLFGLNRESLDSFSTEVSMFNTRISTMESLTASLMEVIGIAGSEDDKAVWLARWNRYVVDAICKKDPVLRGRALIYIGILSKGGVEDLLARTVLEYIAEVCTMELSDSRAVFIAISTIYCLTKITEGLPQESKLFGRMFWLGVLIAHSDLSAIFECGLKFITRCLESMNIKEKFMEGEIISLLLKDKEAFADLLKETEKRDSLEVTQENFDQVLLHFAARGLQLPYSKASCVDCLISLFKFRFMNETIRFEVQGHFDTTPLSYLLFLSILLKPSDLRQVLDDIDLADDFYILNDQLHLPKMLADFLLSDCEASNLALIQLSVFFCHGSPNDKTRLRFMIVLKFVGQRNPHLVLKIYHIIRPSLRLMINSTTVPSDLLSETLDVAALAIVMPEYKENDLMKLKVNELLTRYKINGVTKYTLRLTNAVESDEESSTDRSTVLTKPLIERLYKGL
jgi:hypothetical protein